MKKILFLIIIVFTLNFNVYALTYGGCDYSVVSRMKLLVNNVNISYDYNIINSEVYFSVTLNNITPEMYFVDTLTEKTYTYADTNNGEITIYNYSGTSSNYKFYSNLRGCYGMNIGTKYYKFPIYNVYHTNQLCSDIPEFSLCKKWINKEYTYNQFEKMVNNYKKSLNDLEINEKIEYNKSIFDIIINWYINYYYYLLIPIIIICSSIIFINRRKNKFKL